MSGAALHIVSDFTACCVIVLSFLHNLQFTISQGIFAMDFESYLYNKLWKLEYKLFPSYPRRAKMAHLYL